MSGFPSLARPFALRGTAFRNRMVQAPMCAMYAAPDGSVTPQAIEYYRARARGGAGLVIVEITFTDASGSRAFHAQLGAHDDTMIPGLGELAAAIREEGAVPGLQLGHCGPQRVVVEPPVVAPSPIPWAPGKRVPRELTVAEIEHIVEDHRQAARRLAQAGFELVELHGAHGYLLNAFVTPATNTRSDAYGGSTAKRLRFPLEVVRAVREGLGPKKLISYRLNGDDLLPGGLEIDGYRDVARALVEAGVDLIHVSAGTYRVMERRIPPMYLPEAPFAQYARPIREAAKVPVIASGTIHDLELAERLVREGDADFVSQARPLFADPDLPKKVLSGETRDVRPCIRCNTCLAREQGGLRGYCAVNPRTGREHESALPAAGKKRVAVIGAGPAGIEAALTAAARGHGVSLYERRERIGGQLRLAAQLPFKSTLPRLLAFYEHALQKAGVQVFLNQAMSPGEIAADCVIVALGPHFPFAENPISALEHPEKLGKRVTIVGANTAGSELAWWLGSRRHAVTLLERDAEFDDDVNLIQRLVLPGALQEAGVRVQFNFEYRDRADADSVIHACGARPQDTSAWRAAAPQVYFAGGLTLIDATSSAYRVASRI
ncbi:MAG TPA: FAD-dependent oxidoreductase [Burkholderiales bacterium]|nr:FAD-dependent oxidoreductase [Burkholderiales bacterium]